MKLFADTVEAMNFTKGYTDGRDWHSDAVIPLSDKPEDRGLYIVTTLDRFFHADRDQTTNGNGKVTTKK